MYCNRCGKEMAVGQQFCSTCGTQVVDISELVGGRVQRPIQTKYSWLPARALFGLLLYWLAVMIAAEFVWNAGLVGRQRVAAVNASIILVMLGMVTICMVLERGRWKLWQRIVFVPAAWLAHALLSVPTLFLIVLLFGRKPASGSETFWASIPIVIFAMRQSRLFVYGHPQTNQDAPPITTNNDVLPSVEKQVRQVRVLVAERDRKIVKAQTDLERVLAERYIRLNQELRGMSRREATETVKAQIDQAKAEAAREGTDGLPPNYGDILLEHEHTDEAIRAKLAVVRAEGATDEDIRWWWNLWDIERRLMIKDDDLNRTALFMKSLDDGLTPEQAATVVRKYGPTYGDPNDTRHTAGEDRPLPYELKDRINRYIAKRATKSPATYQQEIDNALIRREIRGGKL